VGQYGGNDHVSKLGEHLKDENFRTSFARDQSQALSDAGINEKALPSGILDTLSNCSPQELATLASVRGALEDAGVDQRHIAQIV
jgi:hypothetical protein